MPEHKGWRAYSRVGASEDGHEALCAIRLSLTAQLAVQAARAHMGAQRQCQGHQNTQMACQIQNGTYATLTLKRMSTGYSPYLRVTGVLKACRLC